MTHRPLVPLDEASVPFYDSPSLLAWARRTDAPRPYPYVVGVEQGGTVHFDEADVAELAQSLWEVMHDIRTRHEAPDWWFYLRANAEHRPVYRAMLDTLAVIALRQEVAD